VTCGLSEYKCPGHLGYIQLCKPSYQPLLLKELIQLLNSGCIYCAHFKVGRTRKEVYLLKLRLLEAGMLSECIDINLDNPYSRYIDPETYENGTYRNNEPLYHSTYRMVLGRASVRATRAARRFLPLEEALC
jgi:DNA-directed RNA polymerase beta' subunit